MNVIANETNLASTGNLTLAAERLAFIQASNEALYAHLDEVSEQIDKNLKELADKFSRSPRATKTIQALEATIAIFEGTIQNQNTKLQNTPQVTDAGSEPQVCTQLKSRSYSIMKPKRSTTKIKSWETKWRKSSNKTPTCPTKLPKNTKHLQKNSRKIQLWLWSRGRSPPICSFNTIATVNLITKLKISPGENHSSKRRSECESHDESKSHDQQEKLNSKSESESRDRNYCQYKTQKFKSESKTKNKNVKAIKVRNEEALTKIRAEGTAKVNEVKAIEKTLTGSKIERDKQLNERIGSEPTITLPPCFATMFNISISTYISIMFTIFIFKNFIPIFKSIVSDPLDHHIQTFTAGDLSDCKNLCLP
jgi:hypothetical protein